MLLLLLSQAFQISPHARFAIFKSIGYGQKMMFFTARPVQPPVNSFVISDHTPYRVAYLLKTTNGRYRSLGDSNLAKLAIEVRRGADWSSSVAWQCPSPRVAGRGRVRTKPPPHFLWLSFTPSPSLPLLSPSSYLFPISSPLCPRCPPHLRPLRLLIIYCWPAYNNYSIAAVATPPLCCSAFEDV